MWGGLKCHPQPQSCFPAHGQAQQGGSMAGASCCSCPAAAHGVVHTDLRITARSPPLDMGGLWRCRPGSPELCVAEGLRHEGEVEGEVAGVPPTPRRLKRITQPSGLPGVSSSPAALPSAPAGYRLSCLSAPGSAPPAFQGPPSPGPGEPLAPCSRPWHNPFVTPLTLFPHPTPTPNYFLSGLFLEHLARAIDPDSQMYSSCSGDLGARLILRFSAAPRAWRVSQASAFD